MPSLPSVIKRVRIQDVDFQVAASGRVTVVATPKASERHRLPRQKTFARTYRPTDRAASTCLRRVANARDADRALLMDVAKSVPWVIHDLYVE